MDNKSIAMDKKVASLIEIVQSKPCLWNSFSTDYKNNLKKQNAWSSVASEMRMSVDECKNIWKNQVKDRLKTKTICNFLPLVRIFRGFQEIILQAFDNSFAHFGNNPRQRSSGNPP